jgi:hypothetical protein
MIFQVAVPWEGSDFCVINKPFKNAFVAPVKTGYSQSLSERGDIILKSYFTVFITLITRETFKRGKATTVNEAMKKVQEIVSGEELEVSCTFARPMKVIVSTNGDPEGFPSRMLYFNSRYYPVHQVVTPSVQFPFQMLFVLNYSTWQYKISFNSVSRS